METNPLTSEVFLVTNSLYLVSLVQGHPRDTAQVIGRLVQESPSTLLFKGWEGALVEGEEPAQYLVYKSAIRYVEALKEDDDNEDDR